MSDFKLISLNMQSSLASPPKGAKQVSRSEKVIERDPAWSWPCEQLKLAQRRRRNHGVGDSERR
jgi:hypothetical protein